MRVNCVLIYLGYEQSFDLPPTGEDFWANREQMLLAIDRGVRKSGIQYAKPTCFVHDKS